MEQAVHFATSTGLGEVQGVLPYLAGAASASRAGLSLHLNLSVKGGNTKRFKS